MKVIFVRSPYKIVIDQPTQILTKVELFVWGADESEPTTPTRILEKQIPDTVNYSCYFNIATYIKDYIDNIKVGAIAFDDENFAMWRKVKVIKYFKDDINNDWTELDTEDFVAVNGYNDYMGGWNQSEASDVVLLTNPKPRIKRADNNQYFNILVDFNPTNEFNLVARYRDLSNAIIEDYIIFDYTVTDAGIYMLKIPYRTATSGLENGNSVQIRLDTTGATPPVERVYFINEPIYTYTPVKCTFINYRGGWQHLTFFKAKTNNFETQSKSFSLLPDTANYNPYRGQKKSFNFEQNQKVRLNTGWVEENYIELLKDLLNSETILLDNIPVVMGTKSIQEKTRLKDKMINYEVDFEYSFNLINNVE